MVRAADYRHASIEQGSCSKHPVYKKIFFVIFASFVFFVVPPGCRYPLCEPRR
jgi:hypothetical protein